MILACSETRIELPRRARISTRINNRIPCPRPARYQSHRRAAKSRSPRYPADAAAATPIAGSSRAPPEASAFLTFEMLRIAGVNQEARYQPGRSQNALIWPAVKYAASLANKTPDRTFADYELVVEAGRGPLRPQQSDSRSALSDRSLFEHV